VDRNEFTQRLFETAFSAAFEHLEETRPDIANLAGFLGIAPEAQPKKKPKTKQAKSSPKAETKPKPEPIVVEAEVIDLKNDGGVWK